VTPLPWKLGPTQDTVDDANGNELLRMQDHVLVREYDDHLAIPLPYAANAAFIVRAVNNHAALLAALKGVMAFYEPDAATYLDTNAWTRMQAEAKAAIAKAEEA
jgi:hypothetical protein